MKLSFRDQEIQDFYEKNRDITAQDVLGKILCPTMRLEDMEWPRKASDLEVEQFKTWKRICDFLEDAKVI